MSKNGTGNITINVNYIPFTAIFSFFFLKVHNIYDIKVI